MNVISLVLIKYIWKKKLFDAYVYQLITEKSVYWILMSFSLFGYL